MTDILADVAQGVRLLRLDQVQYLLLSGGTMTGPLLLASDPVQLMEAATKQYVDSVPIVEGNGDPNGVVQTPKGWLYLDLTTPTMYQNTDGNTAWELKEFDIAGLSAASFGVLAASAPLTGATLTNLVLPIPNITRLTAALTQDTTFFTVIDNTELLSASNGAGLVYIGSEIMRVKRGPTPTTFEVIFHPGDPPPFTGRGLRGSAPIIHTANELVSDSGAILFARFVTDAGAVSPPQPMWVYRVDPLVPAVPGVATPLEQGKPTYAVKWAKSDQLVSGVAGYEVQERGGDPKSLSETVIWRTLDVIPSRLTTYIVGDPTFAGEGPRKPGQFFDYRVRAISGAGVASNWSSLATSANTGLTASILSGVSNFPNPFDSRKGGDLGLTKITYTLNADADTTITIYDALGYLVKTITNAAGSEGGKAGQNFVPWNGRNDAGVLVSKGGYTARIRAKAPGGTATAVRKIGVIH